MSARRVEIIGAPGFVDHFRATVVPGLDCFEVPGEAPVTVILTEIGEALVVPFSTVRDIEEGEL